MPHVIISGMPGIGKTTSVLCLARQLLGDAYKEAVLELNASDERGRVLSLVSNVTDRQVFTFLHRYRRGSQSDQGLCAEKGYLACRAAQACYSRRGR
jgi:DNA polymerase III delta prime subunit